ncbi:MAG: MltA-interacting MipA family protein [Rhizobiales bacterium PAR1]|nr:MAG: MltA-interacting MipA family protein [Rhizobiales bacterium PAR1]
MVAMRHSLLTASFALAALPALAQEPSRLPSWIAGDWSLTLGAAGYMAPRFEGANSLAFNAVPMVSLSRQGKKEIFSSRNDNISLALYETDYFRVGPVGKILFERSDKDRDLRGLGPVRWGGEAGAFVDLFPTHWLRVRTEVRQGFRAHSGVVADFAADAFHDIRPDIRLSAGPRVSLATSSFYKAYYGVNAGQSVASGLAPYSPGGGFRSVGLGGAITWKATEKITTSLFAEYSKLLGPAADSSLVKQRGSTNQFTIGASATYRFDFSL